MESNRLSALRTISLRLRGTSVKVLEEMGEETEGVIESTSKLQEKIKALSGVNILTDSGDYKDTYTILKEIGNVWEDMSDIDQAALLELMAGKNRANTLSAILSNMTDLEGAYESALNAEGSALKENEAYLDSIQGRIDLFNNSVQTMWMNFIDSEVVKFIVNVGTGLIKLADNIGLIQTAIAGLVGYTAFFKKKDFDWLITLTNRNVTKKSGGLQLLGGDDLAAEINNLNSAIKAGPEAFNAYKNAQKNANNGMYQMIQSTEKAEYTTEDYTMALKNMTPEAQRAAVEQQMLSAAISVVAMVAVGAISVLANYISNIKTLEEEYEELQSSISSLESNISSLDSELSTIQEQIDALSNKKLTITEAEELKRLKEQSEELERQKKLQESILKARDKQNQAKSLAMINNYLKTSAAHQKEAAESGKTWGKVIGNVVGAIAGLAAGVGITAATGGVGAGAGAAAGTALSAGVSSAITMALGSVGSSLGGMLGESLGGKAGSSAYETDGSLIGWYESYASAIEKAEQEATAAEIEYLNTLSDKSYQNWQDKIDEVTTLQTEMYDGLEEMQEYIGNLEYNDQTADIINKYNDLMTHLSVESNDGDIEAQISSIESLKDEFYELSRGVDENGKNVALSTEEYARYCSIVDQILAYAPSLIQGYDAEGNAILGTADAQYTYNQLIAESIELLKQQRQEAAKQSITSGEFEKIINAANTGYNESVKSAVKNNAPGSLYYNAGTVMDPEYGSGDSVWDSVSSSAILRTVLDEGIGFFESQEDYLQRNVDLLIEKRDEIEDTLLSSMISNGVDEDRAKQYVEEYMSWIDGIVTTVQTAEEEANAKIRERLYVAPQASDSYDDLSGSQLSFINSYILSFENLKDKTASEVEQIANDIVGLTSLIGSSENLQNSIDELIALDPSSMPIDTYRKKFEELWADVSQFVPEADRNALYSQLFPDASQIDTMMQGVQAKLKDTSKALIKNLTLPELKIAYKYLLEEADGSLTYEELKQKIAELNTEIDGPIVQTYSALKDQVAGFNEVASQTAEIVLNNTQVTQEYKDSLIELGITEEELAECFDSTNGLVVKNAKKLQDLTAKAKKNTSENIKLARSQARLQYYELYKEMSNYISAEGKITGATKNQILTLYNEMNALEKTIAKYTRLEAQLLGAANAYEEFARAQEIDAETDYIGSIEEMILALGEAFSTAELGTETAQAAIKGLIHESIYQDIEALDTVDEKMAAIYEYFKNGKLSEYFTFEFDEDGKLATAEMKLGNLRKFIEDAFTDLDGDGINVFEGSDWQHFDFSEGFLAGLNKTLDEGGDGLQYFADQMGVTKEVAFAFLESLEDHDIEWLNGDYTTLLEKLIPPTLETDIYNAMDAIADLNAQLASGEIDESTYASQIAILNADLAEAKRASLTNMFGEDSIADRDLDNVDGYLEANQRVAEVMDDLTKASTDLTDKTKELEDARAEGLTGDDLKPYENAVEDATKEVEKHTGALNEAVKVRDKFEEPTEMEIQIALDDINAQISAAGDKFNQAISDNFELDENGYYTIKTGVDITQLEAEMPGIQNHVNLLNSRTELTAYANVGSAETSLDTIAQLLEDIYAKVSEPLVVKLDENAVQTVVDNANSILGGLIKSWTITPIINGINAAKGFLTGESGESKAASVNGTAHVRGTAHKSGNWGLPQSEHDSLVGELGPEMVVDPTSGRYYTVGDNGAEMVDLPKGAIIFNHKQTEGLLNNGYITSRGKAYAEGNAHVTIWPNASSKDQWEGTGYSGPDDPTWEALDGAASDLSNAADDLSDSADEFNEVFDWIEVRLEELEETLSLLSAQLENAVYYNEKNNIIDNMINVNKTKLANLNAGYEEYEDYAASLLTKVPEQYREAAKNGAIAIEKFVGEADEATLEAINNYREWIQKAADLKQQAEEIMTTIRDLAIQKFDNAYEAGDIRATVEDSQTEKLQNQVDLLETMGKIASEVYYGINNGKAEGSTGMFENAYKKIEYLTEARKAMQAELNEAVEAGQIQRGSNEWYELIDQMYQIESQIHEANVELEEFQNAINDIYWDNFDQLINRLGYLKDETQNLIDLMDSDDMVVDPQKRRYEGGTVEYWTEDDVKWSDEGLASLGLYAQQMEIAEYTARQYAEAIDDLEKEYKAGHYSENEYVEKLNELKDAQYENIEAYYDAQEAIKDLNETRIDSIKEGIEKEIEAYEELIEKKKEELDAEKDLYDFQKDTMDQQKNIANIERQLAALANDNSMSAIARRKQLEAELAEAQYQLQDTYYNRSVEDKQTALDQELEKFQTEKDAEITKWEEYLTNVEQVVADSLLTIQSNATGIYDTLMGKAEEYDLTLTDSIMTPWQDGAFAVSDYQETFDTAMSSTMDQLEALKRKWQEIIDTMAQVGQAKVDAINKENASYAAATKKEPPKTQSKPAATTPSKPAQTQKTISVGGMINAAGAKIYGWPGGPGDGQYFSNDPIYTVLAENGEWIQVRHRGHSSGVTGWFKKSDVKPYAKGTTSLAKSGIVNIDELGDELLLRAQNGRLTYMEKGSGIVPADLTSNLMKWGELDPTNMLDQNRPAIGVHPEIHNTEVNISISYGDMVSIGEFHGDNPEDIAKIVEKQFEKHTKNLNNAIRKYSR